MSLIEQLETVGMIHRNGEDAALFVNRSFEHLDDWWQSDLVQDARRAFVQKYANFSESWVQEWKNEFEEVILSDTSI